MQTVAIVGVGLIGASFGLAIRQAGFSGTILGVSSASAIRAGLDAGAISCESTLEEAAATADLIYLAQPVDRILETLVKLGPLASKETLVTDAGSTKAEIVRTALIHLQSARFIGGHPMAGKETRGAQSADADLFRDRTYVLTPVTEDIPDAFVSLLRGIGANVLEMTPEQHDATVALTSHLPQLISTALAAFLEQQLAPPIESVYGSGLIDMTRLAMSPADLWASILTTNKQNVQQALQQYGRVLASIQKMLESGDVTEIFQQASMFSGRLRKPAD